MAVRTEFHFDIQMFALPVMGHNLWPLKQDIRQTSLERLQGSEAALCTQSDAQTNCDEILFFQNSAFAM